MGLQRGKDWRWGIVDLDLMGDVALIDILVLNGCMMYMAVYDKSEGVIGAPKLLTSSDRHD